jgi:D-3-phosphoglycerate dehydrogenase
VCTTPHLGAATLDAQPRIARRVAQTFRAFNRHGALRDCVFRPRLQLGLGEIAAGSTLLAVVHSTTRGSRKALQDAIFEAGASNLSTVHQDFEDLGMAYDLSAIDRPLDPEQVRRVVAHAAELTGEVGSIRSLRQVTLA